MGITLRAAAAGATAAALTLGLGLAGCTAGPRDRAPGRGASTVRPVRAGRPTDWVAYHAGPSRSGAVGGLPPAAPLAAGWFARLDGAVYGQPLVVGRTVIAATEHDTVYGIDRSTGRVRWTTHVATPVPMSAQPCGDISPLGITSTPVLYHGLVYVLAQAGRAGHLLVGLSPATGRLRYRRAVPSPDGRPAFDQQRSALAAANGRIYVAFGGHFGDCGPYVGSVVGMPAARSGERGIVSYLVPTSKHAGIWAAAGPVIGPDGTLYVSVGNGATSGPFDGSDSVTMLSPGLRRTGIFAPDDWLADNKGDLDLGSMSPALTGDGQIVIAGKRGIAYLLSAADLGGVGGQRASLRVCPAFGGAAVTGSTVILPCADGGPAAVRASDGRLVLLWRGPAGADGSPVIGGGAVWVTGNAAGMLYELSPATGQVRSRIALGSALPHFASPSLSGRLVLVGTLHGVVALTGA